MDEFVTRCVMAESMIDSLLLTVRIKNKHADLLKLTSKTLEESKKKRMLE